MSASLRAVGILGLLGISSLFGWQLAVFYLTRREASCGLDPVPVYREIALTQDGYPDWYGVLSRHGSPLHTILLVFVALCVSVIVVTLLVRQPAQEK